MAPRPPQAQPRHGAPTEAPTISQPPATEPPAPAAHAAEAKEDPVLAGFRRSIDNIDAALIHMLAERFRITQSVGEYKARIAMAPADPARERRQIERLRRLAVDADLDPEFSEKFIRFVIDEVIRHHQRARGG